MKPYEPETEGLPWKPTMTKTEADIWTKDSIEKKTWYHGTSAGDKIKTEGFKIAGTNKTGRFVGDGVYMAPKEVAESYGKDVLQLKVNVKKTFDYRTIAYTEGNPNQAAMTDFTIKQTKWLIKEKKKFKDAAKSLSEFLKSEGFDSLIYEESAGKLVYVVFDIKKVTVVDDLIGVVRLPKPKVPTWTKTRGGKLFKEEADAVKYNKYFDEYMKKDLIGRKASKIIEKDLNEMFWAFDDWKVDTNSTRPSAIKFIAQRIERKNLKAFRHRHIGMAQIEEHITDEFKDQYLRLRALQQAKFKQEGVKKLKLYRGTNGDKSGPGMRAKVIDLKKKAENAGQNWKIKTIDYEENSLVGYTKKRNLADKFGKHSSISAEKAGVTVVRTIDVEDIVVDWDEIFDYLEHAYEKEVIVLGGKKKLDLGIFSWRD